MGNNFNEDFEDYDREESYMNEVSEGYPENEYLREEREIPDVPWRGDIERIKDHETREAETIHAEEIEGRERQLFHKVAGHQISEEGFTEELETIRQEKNDATARCASEVQLQDERENNMEEDREELHQEEEEK